MKIDAVLSAALHAADRLLARQLKANLHEQDDKRDAAYDELMACLDVCSALPGSAQVAPGIWQRRLVATTIFRRSDEECERALQEVLRIEPELMRRAMSTLSACSQRPELLSKFLPALIEELEAAVECDVSLSQPLAHAYEARVELLAKGSIAPERS